MNIATWPEHIRCACKQVAVLGGLLLNAVEEEGGDDLLIAVCELMAEQPMPEDERVKLRELAIEEQRCVIRVKPDSTFETPPRHVYNPEDVATLTHTLGATLPWEPE
jgi:hypothetical protein